jgi:hypothetical protein
LVSKSHDAEKNESDTDVYYWFSVHKKIPLSSKPKRLINSRAAITIDPYLQNALTRKRPLSKTGQSGKECRAACVEAPVLYAICAR